MRSRKGANRQAVASGLVLIGFAAWIAWLASRLPSRRIPEPVGAAFFPTLLAALLALLAFSLVIRGARGYEGQGETGAPGEWGRSALVVGLMVVYIWALPRLGFLLATPLFLGMTMWMAGVRRWTSLGLAAVGVTVAIFVSFSVIFSVPLPRGLFD